MIVSDASSTCEVLTGLMAMESISYDAAVALYIGIICDTGVFKYSNTSRHTMDMAALMEKKAFPYSDLIDDVFTAKVISRIRFWAMPCRNADLFLTIE